MRSRMTYLTGVAIVLLASLLARQSLAVEETNPPRIRPDRDKSKVVCVSDDWAVYRNSELIESTRFNRGPRFIHRFYRQQLSEPDANFAFRIVGGAGWGDHGVTIKPDGTIFFVDHHTMNWCDPDGTVRSSAEVRNGMIRRVYVDGIVVQAGSRSVNNGKGIEAARALFIPIKGSNLDFEHELEIAPAGVKSLQYDEPARHGDVLTWMAENTLHFFNLQTGARSTIPVDDKNGAEFSLRNASVSAFDGDTILAGSNVVLDAKTGNRLASNWNDKRINRLFATRSRIAYRLKDGQLDAIDIMHPNRLAVHLEVVPTEPVWQNSKGLLIWTGTEWKLVPWLTSLPREDAEQGGQPDRVTLIVIS